MAQCLAAADILVNLVEMDVCDLPRVPWQTPINPALGVEFAEIRVVRDLYG